MNMSKSTMGPISIIIGDHTGLETLFFMKGKAFFFIPTFH